jgi:hypothetical protein
MRTLQPEPVDAKPIKVMSFHDPKPGDVVLVLIGFGAKNPLESMVWTIGLN